MRRRGRDDGHHVEDLDEDLDFSYLLFGGCGQEAALGCGHRAHGSSASGDEVGSDLPIPLLSSNILLLHY